LAQRLEQLARPGGVCISAAIREALRGRLSFNYEHLGEQTLKAFERRQRAYVVNLASYHTPSAKASARSSSETRVERAFIAVLPFDHLSSDPEQAFFADRMAEDIITASSKFKDLIVIARNSTYAFKGRAVDVAAIGRQLGARYIVEGSVRRAGSRIRLTVQLVDTEGGGHLWAERYGRVLDDIFEIQDEIIKSVLAAVAPEVALAEQGDARRAPIYLDAWGKYQLGLSTAGSFTRDGFSQAVRQLRESIEEDPLFPPPRILLAWTLIREVIAGFSQCPYPLEWVHE
jgi:adenylate cyclase